MLAGGVTVPIPLKEENEFRLTAKELEDAITDKTKADIANINLNFISSSLYQLNAQLLSLIYSAKKRLISPKGTLHLQR